MSHDQDIPTPLLLPRRQLPRTIPLPLSPLFPRRINICSIPLPLKEAQMMQGFQFLRLEVLTAYKSTPVENSGRELALGRFREES